MRGEPAGRRQGRAVEDGARLVPPHAARDVGIGGPPQGIAGHRSPRPTGKLLLPPPCPPPNPPGRLLHPGPHGEAPVLQIPRRLQLRGWILLSFVVFSQIDMFVCLRCLSLEFYWNCMLGAVFE